MSQMLEAALRQMVTILQDGGHTRPTIEAFVLAHGHAFTAQRLTPAERQAVQPMLLSEAWPIKQCYANSQRLLICDMEHRFEYVEGYVFDPRCPLPILHAWLSLNGKVVDVTLRTRTLARGRTWLRDRVVGTFPDRDREYYGVVLPRRLVLGTILETGRGGALLDDWEHGYPLLRTAEVVHG